MLADVLLARTAFFVALKLLMRDFFCTMMISPRIELSAMSWQLTQMLIATDAPNSVFTDTSYKLPVFSIDYSLIHSYASEFRDIKSKVWLV